MMSIKLSKVYAACWCITILCLACVGNVFAGKGAGYSVAVLPFEVAEKGLKGMGEDIQALLTAQLSGQPAFMLVERGAVDAAFSEMALGLSGTVSTETAATVGQITGAQVLVMGRAFTVGKELVLVAKIVGVETSRVYGATESMPIRGSLVKASAALAAKIAAMVTAQGATLVAPPVLREDIVAQLQQQVVGKTLPSVSIDIPEISLTRRVPDPAAETEIGFVLQQLGFELVDTQASNRLADIEITGEAFSEFGLRKGSLVSTKARIEIKVIIRSSGRVVLVDRQTAVAVELSPEIAGKAALAKGAQQLVKRIVAAIVKHL